MTDGTHAMRGCEPCQGRKAAAISIVSCVPWEFSAPSILRFAYSASMKNRRFLFIQKHGRFVDASDFKPFSIRQKAGAWRTGADGRQKAILPRRGRIALSANERTAEFLDFAIQAKFAYVNKLSRCMAHRRENENDITPLQTFF